MDGLSDAEQAAFRAMNTAVSDYYEALHEGTCSDHDCAEHIALYQPMKDAQAAFIASVRAAAVGAAAPRDEAERLRVALVSIAKLGSGPTRADLATAVVTARRALESIPAAGTASAAGASSSAAALRDEG